MRYCWHWKLIRQHGIPQTTLKPLGDQIKWTPTWHFGCGPLRGPTKYARENMENVTEMIFRIMLAWSAVHGAGKEDQIDAGRRVRATCWGHRAVCLGVPIDIMEPIMPPRNLLFAWAVDLCFPRHGSHHGCDTSLGCHSAVPMLVKPCVTFMSVHECTFIHAWGGKKKWFCVVNRYYLLFLPFTRFFLDLRSEQRQRHNVANFDLLLSLLLDKTQIDTRTHHD